MINQLTADLGLMTLVAATKVHAICEAALEDQLKISDVLELEEDIRSAEQIRVQLVDAVKGADAGSVYSALVMIDRTAQSMQCVMNAMELLYCSMSEEASIC